VSGARALTVCAMQAIASYEEAKKLHAAALVAFNARNKVRASNGAVRCCRPLLTACLLQELSDENVRPIETY